MISLNVIVGALQLQSIQIPRKINAATSTQNIKTFKRDSCYSLTLFWEIYVIRVAMFCGQTIKIAKV